MARAYLVATLNTGSGITYVERMRIYSAPGTSLTGPTQGSQFFATIFSSGECESFSQAEQQVRDSIEHVPALRNIKHLLE